MSTVAEVPFAVPLDQLDLNDPALFAEGPPHALFARMRSEAPVLWNRPCAINDGFWSVTGYADEVAVLNDWKTSPPRGAASSCRRRGSCPRSSPASCSR